MHITKYLIENPIVKWMILIILFTASYLAITQVKRFAYPRVDLNQMTITAVVPSFSVNEIEIQVARKINNKLKTIDGIKFFKTTSYPNYAFVFLEIEPESDVDEVKDKIRNGINSISDFPSEMESLPKVSEIKIDNKPTMVLGITPKDKGNYDPVQFSRLSLALCDEFRNSDSVSLVYEDIPEREIQILLNKDKILKYQITFEEVYQQISSSQVRLTAGDIKSEQEVKNIITISEKKSPSEIEDIILRLGGYGLPNSPLVKVGDIGKAVFALPPPDMIYHINGKPGHRIQVVKKAQIDIIDFSQKMEELIDKFHDAHPEINISVHENDSWETEQRLSITLNSGISSLLLIAVVLFLFLKLPIAFWSILEMPITILFSIILIWVADVTINNISLCGIILTLGIIVDNPTVIGELTMYYQEKGYSPAEASLTALKKIIKPLIFSLLTTLASFGSMFFIPGILGDFAIEIPLTVTFMLASSFIESVFILPSHLTHTRYYSRPPWGDKFLHLNKKAYHRTLKVILKRPLVFFIVITAVFGLMTWKASQGVNFYLFSTEQSNKITIEGNTPSNSNLKFTESQVFVIEKVIDELPEGTVFSYFTKIGGENLNSFRIEIILTPFFTRDLNANQIKKTITEKVSETNLNLSTIYYAVDSGGPPSGKPIEINIFHPDKEIRKKVITEIMGDLKSNPIFFEINTDYEEGQSEIQVIPKSEAYFSGIGVKRISQILRFAFGGIKVNETEIDNQNTKWILKLDSESRNFSDPLENLIITSPTGIATQLSELVTTIETNDVLKINSKNGKTMNVISASFDTQNNSSQTVLLDLSERYRGWEEKISGLEITYDGEAKESFNTFQKFIFAILGSGLLIYMLLVIQFKNLIQPFLVISSIPFGIAGIIIAFNLQNTNISFLTMVGILGFGGVVVNSSIIMIDFINNLRSNYSEHHSETNYDDKTHPQEGVVPISQTLDIKEIVIEGALARFRPIVITTVSSVMGFFPLAYAVVGQTDSIIAPMSMGMVWGMLFGTTAALFIVPALYLANEQIFLSFKKKRSQKKNI